jgi:hypothetical protein
MPEWMTLLAVLIVYVVLMKWVLPKIGVPT